MKTSLPTLPSGYSPLAPGQIATLVVSLEMLAPPATRNMVSAPKNLSLARLGRAELSAYRALFRAVGEDWLWTQRLTLSDAQLAATLANPDLEVYAATAGEALVGILELDFGDAGECEIAYFGLTRAWIGKGAGRWLMGEALARAWARPIDRLWLHTCNFDHPGALGFYQRSGFNLYAMLVEVMDDPRLCGVLPRQAAPHVPLIPPLPR